MRYFQSPLRTADCCRALWRQKTSRPQNPCRVTQVRQEADTIDALRDRPTGGGEQEMVRDHADWSPLARSQSMVDPDLLSAFADNAGLTLRWLENAGLRFDFLPTDFTTTTTTRLLPVSGGLAMVETLTAACKAKGAEFRLETTAQALLTRDGAVIGIASNAGPIAVDAAILACGGFEGNPEMLARYIGAKAINLRPVARGGHYNKGEGIRMALDIGAAPNGDFGSYHAEPIDPRSGIAEPAIFTFPYGILVNKAGKRFTASSMALVGGGRLRLLPLAATVQPEVSSPGLATPSLTRRGPRRRPFLAETRNPGLPRPPLRFGPPPIRLAEWNPECVQQCKPLPQTSH